MSKAKLLSKDMEADKNRGKYFEGGSPRRRRPVPVAGTRALGRRRGGRRWHA